MGPSARGGKTKSQRKKKMKIEKVKSSFAFHFRNDKVSSEVTIVELSYELMM